MPNRSLLLKLVSGVCTIVFGLNVHAQNNELTEQKSAQLFELKAKKPTPVSKTALLASGDERTVYTEQGELIRAPRAVAALGPDLFGDKVSLYHGGLEFVHNDVAILGNSSLPVSVGRRLTTGSLGNEYKGHFRNWELEIPRIHGIYSTQYGFQKLNGTTPSTARCTNFGAPPPVYQSGTTGPRFRSTEYWNGNMLYVPGKGDQEILARSSTGMPVIPTNGSATPLVTRDLWAVQCVGSLASTNASTPANEAGEGFKVISPDGTTYLFNWLVSRPINPLTKEVRIGTSTGHFSMARTEVWILPTVITDRFGNTVTYSYDPTDKWKLNTIVASDGRTITLTYQPGTHVIQSLTDGTRTWSYGYATSQFGGTMLSTVTLPDNSSWQLAGLDGLPGQQGLLDARIIYGGPSGGVEPDCDSQPNEMNSSVAVGSMIHPSGAIGTFTISPESHARSMVPKLCFTDDTHVPARAYYPRYFDSYSLTQKTISGPGLQPMTWSTTYDTFYPSWDDCDCYTNAYVFVTDPKGIVTRYTFGNSFYVAGRANYPAGKPEGELLAIDVGWNGSTATRTTTFVYEDSLPAVGTSEQNRGDFTSTGRPIPLKQRTINLQGVNFNWQVATTDFDNLARVKKATLSSSLGMSKTESTVYKDYSDKWVMGQILTITDASGAVPVANTYDDARAGALSTRKLFGKLQMTLVHNADGTLSTYADGLGQTTTYTNYKRGLAQNIAYPPGLGSESAVVNNIGNITSRIDAAGYSTSYGYDAMGRLNLITPQAGYATGLTLAYINSDEYGIGAGHWRQTISTGNATKVTYLDGMMRPAVVRNYDLSNVVGTASTVLQRFDHQGKLIFASYPVTDISSINDNLAGTTTQYDELQRVTLITADSELGQLNTTTNYLNGFVTQVVDPAGHTTTSGYQGFDNPDAVAVTSVALPENVSVAIARDNYGKSQSITRSGNGKTATRNYVYDANQLLCKTIEPEIGATVQQLDLANNISWQATGLALPSTSTCDQSSVPAASKVSYTYDGLNRLKNTNFSDGSPNIARTYTPDGLLATVNTDGAAPTVWTLGYDARRILNNEKLVFGGVTYEFVRGIDNFGNLSQLTYPGSTGFPGTTAVTFAPNALGQPGKISSTAGTYASNISYYPNGAVKGFSYGNGIVHSLTQNTRGLPQNAIDGSIVNDTYSYDQDGNVSAIADGTANGMSRSNMVYDGLHRLTSISAPGMWGTATYAYDALDNLTSSTVGGRTSLHNYDSAKNRLTSISSNVSAYNLSYGYDGQGNISQRGTQAFVFDQGNRIKSATGKETYTYDGFGHRVQELAADGTKLIQIYSSSGQLLMASQTGGGKPAKDTKYVYLNRHLLAEIELAGATTVSYNHTDALGSPIAKTNASGVRTALTKYEPYGLTLSGSTTPTIGFTGHVNDADTGLIYMQQRYYDPAAGRFLSLDPVSTDAHTGTIFNRYSYANNSPYNYIDPDGRLGVAGFIVGASIDVGVQVAGNMGSGQGLSDSLANVRVGQVLVSGALGAFGQIGGFNAARSIVSGMSNGAKGLIGEGAARIGIAVRGETVIASQTAAGKVAELGNITGRAAKAVPDFVTRAADGTVKVVEAKFGTSGLTGAQRALKGQMGETFTVSRTTTSEVATVAGHVSSVATGLTTETIGKKIND